MVEPERYTVTGGGAKSFFCMDQIGRWTYVGIMAVSGGGWG